MRAVFIVIEALDGVGKTTLCQSLAAALNGVFMNTPGALLRPISSAVLSGLGDNPVAHCLYYASSVISRGTEAQALVAAGKSVVMDRYWLSTLSYARARGVSSDLSAVEGLIPIPDLTVLLTLDEEERQHRLELRGHTAADRETLSPCFRHTVLHEMRSAQRRPELQPTIELDVSGLSKERALERLLAALRQWSDGVQQSNQPTAGAHNA